MARRNDHTKEELKALILEKAWAIVSEQGFDHLTARTLAKEIGYTPGTIYNLFDSMEALYLQLNLKTVALLFKALDQYSAKSKDTEVSIDNMLKMAEAYFRFADKYRPHWLMLFNLNITSDNQNSQTYRQAVNHLFLPLESLLRSYFPDKEKKEIQKAARILWSSVHGLCYLKHSGKIDMIDNDDKTDIMSEYLINTFIRGMS